jgi:hypothetical protein
MSMKLFRTPVRHREENEEGVRQDQNRCPHPTPVGKICTHHIRKQEQGLNDECGSIQIHAGSIERVKNLRVNFSHAA